MRRKRIDCGDAQYEIREIPASLLRKHSDLTELAAQMDMIGLCVLDAEGKPLLDRVDDLIPMRHLEPIINHIADLSGLTEGNADASGTVTPISSSTG